MIPTVMCIDDDTMVHMLCKLIFRETKFCNEVISLLNGAEALAYFEAEAAKSQADRHWPDLIFLDINMPVMDGWGFLESYMDHFAPLHPGCKVMMLSSTVDPDDRKRSMEYGIVVDFLEKPITKEMINRLKGHPDLAPYFL